MMLRKHEFYATCLNDHIMGGLFGHRPGGSQCTKGNLGMRILDL